MKNIKILLIIFGMVFLIGFSWMITDAIGDNQQESDKKWEDIERCSKIKEDSKRLLNETGNPEQFSCEQIEVMIEADSYIPYEINYECIGCYSEEYGWCASSWNSNTKDSFVRHYITNCVSQNYAKEKLE